MGVEVAWVNEDHEHLEFLGDSFGTISGLAISRWPLLLKTVCIRFIDAYGDAVFNQAQLPVLIAELQAEVTLQDDPKDRAHIEKVIELVQGAVGHVHTYIAFLGD
jgi:hypothetical protein